MADNSFGIDIGEKYTRVADVVFKNKKLDIQVLGEQETPPHFFSDDTEKPIELLAELIIRQAKDLKISKRNIRVVLPDSTSFHQVMEFSRLNQKELLSAVRYQADQFIPLPIDDVVFDLEVIKENQITKKNTILVVASPKKVVQRVEKAIEMAGLVPESLETELSAIARFFSEIYLYNDANPSSILVINFGHSSTSLYLFAMPGGTILELRTVQTGFELFVKELKFNLEFQESKAIEVLSTIGFDQNATYDLATFAGPLLRDLVSEITKFVIIAKEKHALPVRKIILCNHDNKLRSLDKKITEMLALPVESLMIRDLIVDNPVTQLHATSMSSYIAAISANIR